MIPRTQSVCQTETQNSEANNSSGQGWQSEMTNAIREPAVLLEQLGLPEQLLSDSLEASKQFPLRVTAEFLQQVRKGDLNDPLLRQILPVADELKISGEFSCDPVGDQAAQVAPGLLHKYPGRVLFITTAACAIHCRYCFRRHYPYSENHPEKYWQSAIEYIKNNPDISEVILSGGDPLSLSTSRLQLLTDYLAAIPHIRRLRIHSRQPIVLPLRIDDAFLGWINSLPWSVSVVVHCNHPNEISGTVAKALHKLHLAGITLLNQSVLLAGVNDNVETQCHLSEALFEHKVLPYYLHMLDKVQGAQHFLVNPETAKNLLREMRNRLPGYLVPKLVEEIAHLPAKQPLT